MKKKYGIFSGKTRTADGLYDLSSPTSREDTVYALTQNSSVAKNRVSQYWKKMKRYYDGLHDINYMTDSFLADMNIPWTPAQSNDGYVHIASCIDNLVKGAAGQAVQNMNLMFGLPEDSGLRLKPSAF